MIVYHGTDKDFTEFLLPEDLPNFASKGGTWKGIYFTDNIDVAKAFAREEWFCKDSPYKKNARLITAKIVFNNPRCILPYESVLIVKSTKDPKDLWEYRKYLQYIGYDCLITLPKQYPEDNYLASRTEGETILCDINEYEGKQYVLFNPKNIVILNSEPLINEGSNSREQKYHQLQVHAGENVYV